MKQSVKEQIKNDTRFLIDDFAFEYHLQISKMLSYKIETISLGSILRYQNNSIFPLIKSDVYKYLQDPLKNKELYNKYCKEICLGEDNKHHNVQIYNELIENLGNNAYDIKKGAIVINQLNIIMDGQHRACILLHLYGPNYKIPVVKIKYAYLGFFTYFNFLKYNVDKWFGK